MSEERAWAAGLFDGEGSIGAYYSGRNWQERRVKYPKANVTNTDKELLDRFLSIVQIEKIYPRKVKFAHYKPAWFWTADGVHNVSIVFDVIGSWLGSVKYKRFEEALGHLSQSVEEIGSNPV